MWLHYLVVLLVPIAIARPRFSVLWLLPVLLWASPRPGYAEGFQTFLPAIAIVIVVTVLLARPAQRSQRDRGRRGCVSVTEHAALGTRRLLSTAPLVAFAGALLVPLIAAAGSDRLAFDFNAAYLPGRGGGMRRRIAVRGARSSASTRRCSPRCSCRSRSSLTDVASIVVFLASLAAVFGALALVGMRDMRCYAAVVVWTPGWNAFEMGNVSVALTLDGRTGLALPRHQLAGRRSLGFSLAATLFFAPLVVWSVATRRARLVWQALAIAASLVLLSWAVKGFEDLRSFPDQVREVHFNQIYSLVGIAEALGLGSLRSGAWRCCSPGACSSSGSWCSGAA